MTGLPGAWRTRWWRWALPLAVVIANAVVLIVHPGRTGAGFADMEKELQSETRVLQVMTDKEKAIVAVLDDARSSREALKVLYSDRFASQEARLTQLISEVKKLAQRAGLEPKSISYPEEELEEYGLVRMSLVFGVKGTYPQLRMLVNLLEQSDFFLVLERVALNDSKAAELGIGLAISTFFVREPDALEAIEAPAAREAEARDAGPREPQRTAASRSTRS
jgi:hypothetical protein